jgi:cytoskeletal protein CcmA (bactofilin family)
MNEIEDIKSENFSFLGVNNTLRGEFELTGNIKVCSFIEGKIALDEGGQLTIEREGMIKGELNCYDVEIIGRFDGKLESRGKVIIRSSASVSGEITAKSLAIYPGAIVNVKGFTH